MPGEGVFDARDELRTLIPGEGEMANLIRGKDWNETSLGHPRTWPDNLLSAVNILLGSRYPMEIWWGPQYLRFYNDAYRPLLGPHRHPQYLGRPGQECWAELWDEIGPMLDGVMETGQATYSEDALLMMTRKGFVEETYVSWSYGPIRNRDGTIGGIFCACDETTKKVLSRRRLNVLHELGLSARLPNGTSQAFRILSRSTPDIPFALAYRRQEGQETEILLGDVGINESQLAKLRLHPSTWESGAELGAYQPNIITNLNDVLGVVPEGEWPEKPHLAVAFQLPNQADILILGVSPRLELDEDYLEFLGLVARHFGSTIEAAESRHQLEQDRLRLRAAFMQSPAFMCILRGPRHTFDFVNEPYMELIGKRDILGKTVAEAIPEIVAQGFIEVLDEVYKTGTPYIGKDAEVFLQKAEEAPLSRVYVNFVYQPIQEPDGSISGIFVHGIDITDEKKGQREREQLLLSEKAARAEAERSSQMKDEFLATLSHELRTPLNAILGWSNVLRSGKVSGKELLAGLETIERNARAQTQIIDDLLDMSRIISGKVRLDVQRIDVQEILREAALTVQAAADAKGIRIQQVLDPLAGPVCGDPSRLQQVFWNLLNNSIKFTERGGRVQVLLERVNSHIEISVVDTGQGIKPEFLPHVFDRFQQEDSTITRRHGGLGLGLAIVKQLVELHGGKVRAKSPGEGKGATFSVILPLTAVHEEQHHEDRRHPRAGRPLTTATPLSLNGINVLAVDDEPDARALVKTVLEASQANVTTAANAKEALLLAMANKFDVLLCDIGMPDEDGYHFMEKIRDSDGLNATTPAVALTAYARSEDRTKALRAGFQMHLSKPVEPVELVTVTASLAGKPRKLIS